MGTIHVGTGPGYNAQQKASDQHLHSRGNHKQSEKTTHRTGGNIVNKAIDKGIISKIYKQLIQYDAKRTNNSIKNGRPK